MEVKKQNGDEDLLSTVEFECLSSYQNQDLRYFLLAYRLSLLREQSWHYVSQHVISTRLEYNLLRRAFQFFLFIQHCWLCWCAGILCTYCFYGGHSTYRMGNLWHGIQIRALLVISTDLWRWAFMFLQVSFLFFSFCLWRCRWIKDNREDKLNYCNSNYLHLESE